MFKKMKAAVVLDNYKAPIFREHLKDAGFEWKEFPGPFKNQQTWQVEFLPGQLQKLNETLQTATNIAHRQN